MVIKAKEAVDNIVLKVQDTGGQPIFLSILELLTTPEGTIYLVVFSLPKLQQAFEDTVETTVGQLKSIQLFATGAPVILVGTRKDDVTGGAKALKDLSTKLLAALQSQCGPAVKGLERDSERETSASLPSRTPRASRVTRPFASLSRPSSALRASCRQ
jgi:hypothetical protein